MEISTATALIDEDGSGGLLELFLFGYGMINGILSEQVNIQHASML
jgi:hypothetical protein